MAENYQSVLGISLAASQKRQSFYEKEFPKTWRALQNAYAELWRYVESLQCRKETQNDERNRKSLFRDLDDQLRREWNDRPNADQRQTAKDWYLEQREIAQCLSSRAEELTESEKGLKEDEWSHIYRQFHVQDVRERIWRNEEGQADRQDQPSNSGVRSANEDPMSLADIELSRRRVEIGELAAANNRLILEQREKIALRRESILQGMADGCGPPFTFVTDVGRELCEPLPPETTSTTPPPSPSDGYDSSKEDDYECQPLSTDESQVKLNADDYMTVTDEDKDNGVNGSDDTAEITDVDDVSIPGRLTECQDDWFVDHAKNGIATSTCSHVEVTDQRCCAQAKDLCHEFENQPPSKPLFPDGPALSMGEQRQLDICEYAERLRAFYNHNGSMDAELETAKALADFKEINGSSQEQGDAEIHGNLLTREEIPSTNHGIDHGGFRCQDVQTLCQGIGSYFLVGQKSDADRDNPAIRSLRHIYGVVKGHSPSFLLLGERLDVLRTRWKELLTQTPGLQVPCVIFVEPLLPELDAEYHVNAVTLGREISELLSVFESTDSTSRKLCIFLLSTTKKGGQGRKLISVPSFEQSLTVISAGQDLLNFEPSQMPKVFAKDTQPFRIILCSLLDSVTRHGREPSISFAEKDRHLKAVPLQEMLRYYLSEHKSHGYRPYLCDNTLKALTASYLAQEGLLQSVYNRMLGRNTYTPNRQTLTVAIAFAFSLFLEYHRPCVIKGPFFW